MSMTNLEAADRSRAAGHEVSPEIREAAAAFKPLGKNRLILRRFLRNIPAVAGVVVLVLLAVYALTGQHLTQWHYSDLDFINRNQGPSALHWFGTNTAGQDMFALLSEAVRISLTIGLIVGVLTPIISLVFGCAIAYFGGWIERGGMWLLETLIMFPQIIIIGIFMSGRGGDPYVLAFIMVMFGWMASARLIRGMALSFIDRDFIKAARFMGVHPFRIVVRHLAPNLASLAIINATTSIWAAILAEISLSFLGLGVSPPQTSLGLLIAGARAYVFASPWMFWGPVVVFMLIVGSLALINDGLRDALDPNSRASGKAKK